MEKAQEKVTKFVESWAEMKAAQKEKKGHEDPAFTKNEVEPQALQYNREERFNRALFERAGELGLLGVTADPEYGGAGMDATAACIVHEVPYDAPSCHDAGPVA